MKDEIIKLRRQGLSYNEISKILNCSKGTINHHCSKLKENNEIKSQNLEIKRQKQIKDDSFLLPDEKIIEATNKRNFGKCENEELIQKIKARYEILQSCRKVSKELGVSKDMVLKFANIIKRNKLSDEDIKKNRIKGVVSWRKRTKQKFVEYLGGKCCRCGYGKCIESLQFHHKNPDEKDFTISGKSWSFEKLKKEVDKCILLCANCHIEIHYEKN